MTLPRNPNDAAPVVLQEPERDLAPAWQTTGNRGFVLRPEEDGVPNPNATLHQGWAQVLAPGETALWQGAPVADPRFGGALAKGALPWVLFGFTALVMLMNGALNGAILPFVLFAGYMFLRQKMRAPKGRADPDRRYLLTNRAAYIARAVGSALHDIQAFPITPTLRLGLGQRSVVFTTRRNAKGNEEAEGFLDIEGAANVHAMIRDVQKGLA